MDFSNPLHALNDPISHHMKYHWLHQHEILPEDEKPSGFNNAMNVLGMIGGNPMVKLLGGFLGARNQRRAQISSAREQMKFQKMMSDTAYQRTMADMKKAGINPVMVSKLGGASTPSGAQAKMENMALQMAQTETALANASSAQSMARLNKANAETAEVNNAYISKHNKKYPNNLISKDVLQYTPKNVELSKLFQEFDIIEILREAGVGQKEAVQVLREIKKFAKEPTKAGSFLNQMFWKVLGW